ncbi:MAG: DUF6578 domain-containing protein [Pseudonocardiaceae bacterium]
MPGAVVLRSQSSARVKKLHRFTEPTPTSMASGESVEIFVSSWEIECCAPPPVVGHPSSWALIFFTDASEDNREFHRDSCWRVVDNGSAPVLVNGTITAMWPSFNGPAPAPGPARLRGYLSGTAHGGLIPPDFPTITGVVQRIRLAAQRFVLGETRVGRALQPAPGTLTLTDVPRSPRWFASPRPQTEDHPDNPPSQIGVLLDLTIARHRRRGSGG